MIKDDYARAYVEVLACMRLLKKEDYDKIPVKLIKYFEDNKDVNYNFEIDCNTLNDRKLSEEANAINLYIYMNYFSTEARNKKIRYILIENEKKYQEMLSKKYSTDKLFKKK